jgi:RimJ/RimL family protein N-acetyltransferase
MDPQPQAGKEGLIGTVRPVRSGSKCAGGMAEGTSGRANTDMTTVIEIPTLRTDRLLLRSFQASDWEAFAAMEAKEPVRRYRGGNVLNREQAWTSMQLLLGQWPLRGYGVLALEAAGGVFVGFAGILQPADWPGPELAYSLDEPYWGQGLATEAATAARDWAFAQFRLPRLVSFIAAGNVGSKRVAAKLGAVHEGAVELRGFPAERWVHPAPGTGVVV